MSFWFLTTFAGNSLTAFVAKVNVFQGATYFAFFTVLMVAASFAFAWIASSYKVHDYFADDKTKGGKTAEPAAA